MDGRDIFGTNLQALVDGLGMQWQRERAQKGLTLGGLLTILRELAQNREIVGIGGPISYRGYYCDLAFEPSDRVRTVYDLRKQCEEECMGQIFEGYKGGDFMMGANTPVWIAGYGDCGVRLVGLNTDSDPITPITAPEDDDA